MQRRAAVCLATAFCVGGAASLAYAHHSHPYFYDQCRSVTVEGRVESVEWQDPHTWIVLRRDDGSAYTVDWNPLSRLTGSGMIGPARAALVSGSRIAVTGSPIRSAAEIQGYFPDFKSEVNPNVIDPTLIRRVDDSWTWARTPSDAMPPSAPAPQCAEAATR